MAEPMPSSPRQVNGGLFYSLKILTVCFKNEIIEVFEMT